MLRQFLSLISKRSGWLLCCALCQCGASPGAEPGLAAARSAIVDGEPSPAGAQDAVLLLRTMVDGQELLCTASLVAPNLALTARHCVAHLEEGQFNCSVEGELVDNPTGAGRIGLDLPASSLEFYGGAVPRSTPLAHGLSIVSTLSDTICVNDIAFVVLDRAVMLPVLPLRLHGRAAVGEAVTLVGYGLVSDAQQTIVYTSQPRAQKTGLSITGVGPDSLADGVTTVPPRALSLAGPSGCVGDSGGPLLAASSNAVLGVYSLLGGASCSDPRVRHQLVHVPAFQTLIAQAFAAAGAEPTPETLPAALGAAGASADASAGGDSSADANAGAGGGSDAGGSDADGSDADAGADTDASAASRASARGTATPSGGCAMALARARVGSWLAWLGLMLAVASSRARAAQTRRSRRQWRPSSGSLGRRGAAAEPAGTADATL
ncbi:MAG TPA: trypsin-like serine protease [Polyangiaceae bacterium]|nr:trypsin-like serine protease [Polyangiaceae bacterium]